MKLLRLLRRGLAPLLFCALPFVAGCAMQSTTPHEQLDEAEHDVYLQRVTDLAREPGRNELIYAPLEAMEGAQDVGPLPVRAPPARHIDAAALEDARAYAARNNSSALLVWQAGAMELEAWFGETTRDALLVSKSLAKPLAAVAVGRAIELGALRSLEQPVADFIPEWRDSAKAEIRIRHLLDMRAGFLLQGPVDDPASIWARSYLSPQHEHVIVHEYPLTHTPGTHYDYSNAPSDLIALVIEHATGRRYAEFVSSEVLAPIGAPGGSVWINRPDGLAHSGCCALLPAETWLRLGILLAQDGHWQERRLLPAGFVDEMRQTSAANPHAGFGVYVGTPYAERRGAHNPSIDRGRTWHSEPYLADDLFLFDGNSNQVVYIVPSKQLVILRMGDSPPRSPEWDNAYLPNRLLRGLDDRRENDR